MDKEVRNLIQRATQDARRLLEREYQEQLEGTFDILANGAMGAKPGQHLDAVQKLVRQKLVAAVEHKLAGGMKPVEAVAAYLREAAFTTLNRFAALKMLEARRLVQECVSKGEQSAGFREFQGLAPGLASLPDHGYRMYIESLFDEIGREVRVLFDRQDPASLLWPRRQAFLDLLEVLNRQDLQAVWAEDETIGWVYQYFNGDDERKQMRAESSAPRNSRELAVRNQFFTPRYVVEFLTDNTLGRIWYEMRRGRTSLKEKCGYMVRRPHEIFLGGGYLTEGLPGYANIARVLEGDISQLPEDADWDTIESLALCIAGYEYFDSEDLFRLFSRREEEYKGTGRWQGNAQELWLCLFAEQRRWHDSEPPEGDDLQQIQALYKALRAELQKDTSDLSQQELLREPVVVPYRKPKDPRELKILDPACGSGHFLLYCFDLLMTIYEEAWHGSDTFGSDAARKKLHEDYPTIEALRAALPGLILQYNLHGIDIDPRCAQIAAFALWMRAQRAYNDLCMPRGERPAIRKTNIVVAEPMPGEKDLLEEFLRDLREDRLEGLMQRALRMGDGQRVRATKAMADSLCELARNVWDKMRLAGEAGSLLKIEQELALAIAKGREEWEEKLPLFRITEYGLSGEQSEKYIQHVPGQEADFWDKAESLVLAALHDYAGRAGADVGFRRRLFAGDTVQVFGFIDLCRKHYDAVLMNPPFGDASLPSRAYIEEVYGDTRGDVYKAFVECFQARLVPAGYLGVISSRTGFFLGQSADWRTRIVLRLFRPIALADLGTGVLDAMVEVAAYVLRSLSEQEARDLILSLVPVLGRVALDRQERFSLPKWQSARDGLKRHQAVAELEHLEAAGFIQRCPGDVVRYTPLWRMVKSVTTPPESAVFPTLTCIRLLEEKDKGSSLASVVRDARDCRHFVCQPASFLAVPSRSFGYWVSERVRRTFLRFPSLETDGRALRVGLQTSDDFRFVRAAWETPGLERGSWFPFAKGGAFSPYYADVFLAVNWGGFGDEMKAWAGSLYNESHWSRIIKNTEFYLRPGLTWPRRTQSGLALRVMPAGCVFADKGPAAFDGTDDPDVLLSMLAITNSASFRGLVSLQMAFGSFEVGVLQRTAFPPLDRSSRSKLAQLAHHAWAAKRSVDVACPVSHAFSLPALLVVPGATLAERATAWASHLCTNEMTVAAIQAEIDDLTSHLYGLDAADRAALTATLATESVADGVSEDGEEEEEITPSADASALVADLLDYALGAAFGRWDVRVVIDRRSTKPHPGPFDPLPVCPPGMLQNSERLPATPADVPSDYPVHVAWDGILVDDQGHDHDLVGRSQEVFQSVFGDMAEAMWRESAEVLGNRGRDLRDWFGRCFLGSHIRRYSKSRRKAPLYWQLATPLANYSVWLYYHRLTPDTLYRVLNDYVKPKIEHESRKRDRVRVEAGAEPTRSQRSELDAQEMFVAELKTFQEEIERIAPLWCPDLNDGVIINFAPLWRLVPQHRSWQKECKECWDSLVAEEYDWSHLAMHLWPERVVLKCATDRSLAIAHGLEGMFWYQDEDDEKWYPRDVPKAQVEALVKERTSASVKAALNSLLSAPSPQGSSKRGGRKNGR